MFQLWNGENRNLPVKMFYNKCYFFESRSCSHYYRWRDFTVMAVDFWTIIQFTIVVADVGRATLWLAFCSSVYNNKSYCKRCFSLSLSRFCCCCGFFISNVFGQHFIQQLWMIAYLLSNISLSRINMRVNIIRIRSLIMARTNCWFVWMPTLQ